jgi:hypothetical protein
LCFPKYLHPILEVRQNILNKKNVENSTNFKRKEKLTISTCKSRMETLDLGTIGAAGAVFFRFISEGCDESGDLVTLEVLETVRERETPLGLGLVELWLDDDKVTFLGATKIGGGPPPTGESDCEDTELSAGAALLVPDDSSDGTGTRDIPQLRPLSVVYQRDNDSIITLD